MKLRTARARLRLAAKRVPKVAQAAQRTASKRSFLSADDPLGSYTGTPADGGKPIQDADDL